MVVAKFVYQSLKEALVIEGKINFILHSQLTKKQCQLWLQILYFCTVI